MPHSFDGPSPYALTRELIVAGGEDIISRIEAALEKARWRKLKLRGLYLDSDDYADFAYAQTVKWQQETGSSAMLWPLSYDNVLILGTKALPVKSATRSAVYAESGEAIYIAKRLSLRVAQSEAA